MTLTRPHSQNIELILLVRRLRKKRKRTMYIRELFDKRPQLGDYHQLVQELRQVDPEYHFKYFRMTKAKFDHLLSLVYERILQAPNHRRPIRPAERLAVTLRFLATGASMQDIAMSYCMHATTVAGILKETLAAIWDCLSPLVLKPPAAADWVKIRRAYSSKWNFPNVVGSIDGKHFAIQCPDNSGSDYFNYKGFYSIVLLAVADADYRFTLVEVGAQGRTSDGAFFNDSSIREVFEHGSLELPTAVNGWPVFMVGDAAFPLRTYLMCPYPGRQLDERKIIFNYRLSRARRCVENAFGILVSRWRAFLGTVTGQPELLTDMVKAAVCLHNFLMVDSAYCPAGYGDTVCGEEIQDGYWRHAITPVGATAVSSSNRSSPTAMSLRDDISNYFLSAAGSVPWQVKVIRRN
ncbi:uncharacterized protein LOC125945036 [Dermacentor silvarum]|uniref:uncharacterized protein LOC125945036 n=1 Tax=Dermacentor silvarum TaxID=543639 RepID=UPI0021013CD5|nr:uncharacterized protein LOC125945036 [Dermacentor silvarum]